MLGMPDETRSPRQEEQNRLLHDGLGATHKGQLLAWPFRSEDRSPVSFRTIGPHRSASIPTPIGRAGPEENELFRLGGATLHGITQSIQLPRSCSFSQSNPFTWAVQFAVRKTGCSAKLFDSDGNSMTRFFQTVWAKGLMIGLMLSMLPQFHVYVHVLFRKVTCFLLRLSPARHPQDGAMAASSCETWRAIS